MSQIKLIIPDGEFVYKKVSKPLFSSVCKVCDFFDVCDGKHYSLCTVLGLCSTVTIDGDILKTTECCFKCVSNGTSTLNK